MNFALYFTELGQLAYLQPSRPWTACQNLISWPEVTFKASDMPSRFTFWDTRRISPGYRETVRCQQHYNNLQNQSFAHRPWAAAAVRGRSCQVRRKRHRPGRERRPSTPSDPPTWAHGTGNRTYVKSRLGGFSKTNQGDWAAMKGEN